jgi:hypothetical protein
MGIVVTGSAGFDSNSKYPKAAQKEIAARPQQPPAPRKNTPRRGNSLNCEAMR